MIPSPLLPYNQNYYAIVNEFLFSATYFMFPYRNSRLHCSQNSVHCLKAKSLPQDAECNKTLSWWFSEEALQAWKIKSNTPVERKVILPKICKNLIP